MKTESANGTLASSGRLLEMLKDRFGAFAAIAMASIKLARHVTEDELSMDRLVAEAVLEFGDDLRAGSEAADRWTPEQVASRTNESHSEPKNNERARGPASSPPRPLTRATGKTTR